MRGYVFLAAFLASASRVASHPLCYVDDRPTDTGRQHTFCPAAQDGACCNAAEEDEIQLRFEGAGTLSDDCADLYKQVGRAASPCYGVERLVATAKQTIRQRANQILVGLEGSPNITDPLCM